jgi:hypothetical protein
VAKIADTELINRNPYDASQNRQWEAPKEKGPERELPGQLPEILNGCSFHSH